MTENANSKPFNISLHVGLSCQTCHAQENSLIGFINRSVNQSTDPFTVKLAEQNSNQTVKNVKGSFTDWVNPL